MPATTADQPKATTEETATMENATKEQSAERDSAALFWAAQWGCNAIYKDVPIGGVFRYRASPPGEFFVKEKNGFRTIQGGAPTGRLWKTGQRTAVVWSRG
jgi:hypothetical protein